MRSDLKALSNDLKAMRSDLKGMRNDFASMKNCCASMKNDLKAMRSDLKALSNDLKAMRSDLKALSNDLKAMRSDLKALSNDLKQRKTCRTAAHQTCPSLPPFPLPSGATIRGCWPCPRNTRPSCTTCQPRISWPEVTAGCFPAIRGVGEYPRQTAFREASWLTM